MAPFAGSIKTGAANSNATVVAVGVMTAVGWRVTGTRVRVAVAVGDEGIGVLLGGTVVLVGAKVGVGGRAVVVGATVALGISVGMAVGATTAVGAGAGVLAQPTLNMISINNVSLDFILWFKFEFNDRTVRAERRGIVMHSVGGASVVLYHAHLPCEFQSFGFGRERQRLRQHRAVIG